MMGEKIPTIAAITSIKGAMVASSFRKFANQVISPVILPVRYAKNKPKNVNAVMIIAMMPSHDAMSPSKLILFHLHLEMYTNFSSLLCLIEISVLFYCTFLFLNFMFIK
jgi:hypothetical protein